MMPLRTSVVIAFNAGLREHLSHACTEQRLHPIVPPYALARPAAN